MCADKQSITNLVAAKSGPLLVASEKNGGVFVRTDDYGYFIKLVVETSPGVEVLEITSNYVEGLDAEEFLINEIKSIGVNIFDNYQKFILSSNKAS